MVWKEGGIRTFGKDRSTRQRHFGALRMLRQSFLSSSAFPIVTLRLPLIASILYPAHNSRRRVVLKVETKCGVKASRALPRNRSAGSFHLGRNGVLMKSPTLAYNKQRPFLSARLKYSPELTCKSHVDGGASPWRHRDRRARGALRGNRRGPGESQVVIRRMPESLREIS